METTDISFSFGQNWQKFAGQYLTPEGIALAKQHIQEFLELSSLEGQSFLDVGCGSGLSSLAAFQLGAQKISSFDLDPYSVKTTQSLRKMAGEPGNWSITQGSILDKSFIQTLEKFDVVYSWGMLHHTGKMWEAFENVATLLSDNGMLYISLYRTTAKSAYWLEVKKRYNQTSPTGKKIMEAWYILRHTILPQLLRCRNPLQPLLNRQRARGMAYLPDLRDWLGGYPYEDASIEEVLRFARKRLNLELLNIDTRESTVEYLFARRN